MKIHVTVTAVAESALLKEGIIVPEVRQAPVPPCVVYTEVNVVAVEMVRVLTHLVQVVIPPAQRYEHFPTGAAL